MASNQFERNEKISLAEFLEEIMKQAKCSLQIAKNESLPVLGGVLTNETKGPLSVMDKNIYEGKISEGFPKPLKVTGYFTMSALSDKGVKAAVVYSGKNKADVECGWLLAFADTAAELKVFVNCGPIDKFKNIDWKEVEKKLDENWQIGGFSDDYTKTSAHAIILVSHGQTTVGARFSG